MRILPEALSRRVGRKMAVVLLATGCMPPSLGHSMGPLSPMAPSGTWAQQRNPSPAPTPASLPPLVEPKYSLPPHLLEPPRRDAAATRQALLGALREVSSTSDTLATSLSQLASRQAGIGSVNGVFLRHVQYGSLQLQWLNSTLASASSLVEAASQVEDEDMQLALLRLAGLRLQAALLGSLLLATWVDFLHLADAILEKYRAYGVENLIVDMSRLQQRVAPSMAALASLQPEQVASSADSLPELMEQLAAEYSSLRERVRRAMENLQKVLLATEIMQMLPMVSSLKHSMPPVSPASSLTLGVGLVVGSNGVMAGTRIVVSAEWVERMRQLVRAGVISTPVVTSAIRIHAGQVLMAQANHQLPQGVREALGEGPEVQAMHETGRAGAGMAEHPRHHVLSKEHREWFEKRGFTGDMDIDQFCVELELANHQAVHGGGNWRLGRTWPGEWNRLIMDALFNAEKKAGQLLTPKAILKIVANMMREYKIQIKFVPWRDRR